MLRIALTRVLASRAAWIAGSVFGDPWQVHRWRAQALARLWRNEYLVRELPAVHALPWRVVEPSRTRRYFMLVGHPVSVRESREIPGEWRGEGPIKQMELVGQAVLAGLHKLRPLFHRSLLGGRLVEATGTTIIVTAQTEDGRDVLAVPWSFGEPFRDVTRRIARARREWTRPLAREIWRAAVRRGRERELPPPQLVLSIVGHLGIQNPETAILASGGAAPIALCVGSRTLSFVFDHRLYDAADAAKLYEEVFS